MKQFIEKLIERLEELGWVFADYYPDGTEIHKVRKKSVAYDDVISIVNQLAEEHKGNLSENLTSSETSITNADKIRAMDASELAGWISNLVRWSEDGEAILSIWDASTKSETRIHDSCGDVLEWLQSEV